MEAIGISRSGRKVKPRKFFGDEAEIRVFSHEATAAPMIKGAPGKRKMQAQNLEDEKRTRSGRKIKPKRFFGDEEEISVSSATAIVTTAQQYGCGRRGETLASDSVVRAVDPVEETKHQEEEDNSHENDTPEEEKPIANGDDELPEPTVPGPKYTGTAASSNGSPGKRMALAPQLSDDANEGEAVEKTKASQLNDEVKRSRFGREIKPKKFFDDKVDIFASSSEVSVTAASKKSRSDSKTADCVVGAVGPVEEENNSHENGTPEEEKSIPNGDDELQEPAVLGPKYIGTAAPSNLGSPRRRKALAPQLGDEANEGEAVEKSKKLASQLNDEVKRSRSGREVKPKKFFDDETDILVSTPEVSVTASPMIRRGYSKRKPLAPESDDKVKNSRSDTKTADSVVGAVDPVEEEEAENQEEEDTSIENDTPETEEQIPIGDDELPEPAALGSKASGIADQSNIGSSGRGKGLSQDLSDEADGGKAAGKSGKLPPVLNNEVKRSRSGREIKPKTFIGDEKGISASTPEIGGTAPMHRRGFKKRKMLAPEYHDEVKRSRSDRKTAGSVVEYVGPVEEEEAEQQEEKDTTFENDTPETEEQIPIGDDELPEPAVLGHEATGTTVPTKIRSSGRRKALSPDLDDEVNEGEAAGKSKNLLPELNDEVKRSHFGRKTADCVVGAVDPVEETEHLEKEDTSNENDSPEEEEPIPIHEDDLQVPAVVGTLQCSNMNTSLLQISNMNILTIALGALASKKLKSKKKSKKRPSFRVKPYLLDRNIKGRFATDFQDLAMSEQMFRENFHMSVDEFEGLFSILKPYLLPKRNTRPNDAIDPKQKLAMVLEFLASGDLLRHISSCYRISKQHFGTIIDLVCNAICDGLRATIPNMNKESFLDIANDYHALWNLPNCVGSIDGKHVALKAPPRSGTMFYSYKGYFTLVMMGICDAHYKFTYLDVGAYGSEGDANIFRHSKLGQQVINDQLQFPEDASVDGVRLPYFFIADDAFPLCKRIIKPYTGKKMTNEELVFNYRLSRARRCIENAFGILSSKWLCLKKILYCGPDRAQRIITACCFLHNYLLSTGKDTYCPLSYADRIDETGNIVEGEWRRNISGLFANGLAPSMGRGSDYGKYVRDNLKNYVNSPIGSLPWQRRAAFVE